MSEVSPQYEERASFADFGGRRPAAFVDSQRHSARVQFLRRAIVVCCVSAVGLIGFVLAFDPLHRLQLGGFNVARVGLEGTRITMDRPRLSGYRGDGQPYEVKAKTVVQDTSKPKVFELEQVDAKLGFKDGTTTRIEAQKGVYNSEIDHLSLTGLVRIRNQGRYDMVLRSATVDMKANRYESTDPVTVTLPDARVEAEQVAYIESEQRLSFTGSVHSVFNVSEGGEPDASDKPEAKP